MHYAVNPHPGYCLKLLYHAENGGAIVDLAIAECALYSMTIYFSLT